MLLTVAAFLFVMGIIVIAHELGHFLAAKRFGVRVYEFSLGFGPSIAHVSVGGTIYSLRAVPLGGFVRLAGMDKPEDSSEDVPDASPESFKAKSLGKKLVTIASGPVMNVAMAVLLFALIFYVVGVPLARVERVLPSSPADAAGFAPGDVIVSVNGRSMPGRDEVTRLIRASAGEQVRFEVRRGEQVVQLVAAPRFDPDVGAAVLGVVLGQQPGPVSAGTAVVRAARLAWDLASSLAVTLGRALTGRARPAVSGPIGIAQAVGQTARLGFASLLFAAAILSLNLGLINLLPIPVLDGGWLVILLLEAVRRRPLDREQETFARLIGTVLIGLLVLYATFQDIGRLGLGGGF